MFLFFLIYFLILFTCTSLLGVIMKIPNIYLGDYRKLIVVPIILILISLFFIPKIKYGIDFTGGMLITAEFENEVKEKDVKLIIEKLTTNYNLKTHKSLTGFVVEVEMEGDKRLLNILENYEKSIKISEEIDALESELAILRQRNESAKINEKEKELIDKENLLSTLLENSIKSANEILEFEKYKFEELKNLRYTEKVKIIHQAYLESKDKWKENFMYELSKLGKINRYSLEEVSPSLSIYFINKVFSVIIVSIILMSILVILIFRLPLPSLIVLSGATIDLIICLGFMGYSGIPLTLASFTALMIMVGLSLDTDMMLCIKILKIGEGNPKERAYEAMQTGFAMTTTTLAAFVALLVLGELTKISVYQQIGLIGTVGLIGDLIGTWLFNAVAVLYYKEKLIKKN